MFAPTASGASLAVSIGKRGTTTGHAKHAAALPGPAVERSPVPFMDRR